MKQEPERKTIATRRQQLVPDEAPRPVPYLIVLTGFEIGRRLQLFPGATVLGRVADECDLCFREDGISRKHAEVALDAEGNVTARDLGSTNGSRLNSMPLSDAPHPLRDGDKLQLGNEVLLELRYQTAFTADLQQQLYSSAFRDPLTEVYNKGYLMQCLEREVAFAVRHETPLALLVLDLDHFKRINDEHGHAGGDAVLKALCRVVEATTRLEDIFARYGGEEFVLLLRESSLKHALTTAERVRGAVAGHAFEHDGQPIAVTLSVGVAVTGPAITTSDELFKAADAALYRAKELGRDRVCSTADEPRGE